jgi:bacteriocin biosynthesis cyclodehydratase domain-containing protein
MYKPNQPNPRFQHVAFIAIDPECDEIYNRLASAIPASVTKLSVAGANIGVEAELIVRTPHFDAFVIVSSRPAESAFALTADTARRSNAVFVPVHFSSGHLYVGPVIVPEKSACWACWLQRRLQHDNFPQESEAIRRFYDRSTHNLSPLIQPLVQLTTCRIVDILSSDRSLQRWAGFIWHFNPHLFLVETGTLVGIDGCSLCGIPRLLEERTYKDLQEWLQTTYTPVAAPGRDGKGS